MGISIVGEIVSGVCTCSPVPYPATGVITTGDPIFTSSGIPVANNVSIIMFPCGTAIPLPIIPEVILSGEIIVGTGSPIMGCATGVLLGLNFQMLF